MPGIFEDPNSGVYFTTLIMYLLIFLSLFNIFILSGRFIGHRGANLISSFTMLLLLVLNLVLYFDSDTYLSFGYFIQRGHFSIDFSLRYDHLASIMLTIVLTITTLVQFFSRSYLESDPHMVRYLSYINLFINAMIILILSHNLFVLLIGWEFVGLSSYLLVNFWYTRLQSNWSSLKALLLNRVGDMFLMLGIMILFNLDNTYELLLSFEHNTTIIHFILLGLFIGAMAKSAQIGLQSWLTSAMEAPTPISALIHAATMVTVGIYLLIRLNPLLAIHDDFLLLVFWLGSITALYGSTGALIEYDIKKIIAFSTVSQLGYMASAIGLSYFSLAFTHLLNHAIYKALLFLTSGIIIYSTGYQDLRNLSKYTLWSIYFFILIGSFNLIAFPFTLGFFSKEMILDIAFHKNLFIYMNLLLAAILTTLYSIRMCIYIFNKKGLTLVTHQSIQQYIVVLILTVILFLLPNLLDMLTITIPMTIGFVQDTIVSRSMILIHSIVMIILILIVIQTCFHITYPRLNWSYIYSQDIVHNWLIWSYRKCCNIIYRYIDRGILEIMGPYGPIKLFQYYSFLIDSNYYLRFFTFTSIVIFLVLI